ncbi:MAG: glycosyltransferase family 39 protein [Anaerolineae bacterium]|nr:glycosyltransferase family 39 protein [Anaerolineae bacterium]
MSQRWKLTLAAILLLALVIRVWGIAFGLPHRYHIDEPHYVLGALNLGRGEFHLTQPQNTPNLWQFILLGDYVILFLIGRIAGAFSQPNDLATLYLTDPSVFYLIGRLSSVIAGVATVALTYRLGKEAFNRQTGMFAAFFLSLSFLHVRDSHYAVSDAFVVLMTTFVCYASVTYAHGGGRRFLLLGAMACGVAIGMKYRPMTFVLPLMLAAIWRLGQGGTPKLSLVLRTYLLLVGALGAGFLIGFPGVILNTAVFQHHVEAAIQQAGVSQGEIVIRPATVSYAWLLVVGMGLPMAVASVGGMGLSLGKIRRAALLVALTALAYYFLIDLVRPHLARYALPLLPLLAVFAGFSVHSLLRWIGSQRPAWVGLCGVILIMLLAGIPFADVVRLNYLLTQVDTRTLAKTWIEENLPSDSKIAQDCTCYVPPLSTSSDPEPRSRRVYDLFFAMGSGLSDYPIQYYRDQGFQYLITSSFISDNLRADPNRREFYVSLDRELEIVQEFRPNKGDIELPFVLDEIYGPIVSQWQRERPGPVLKIYKIKEPVSTR